MQADRPLPSFLGIGAQRCGTTWLDAQLRRHPQVVMPTRRKEVHFFDQYYDRGWDWYRGFFPDAAQLPDDAATGEITPRYLFSADAAERIARDCPQARLIAVLRNPVDRAYSQYGLSVTKQGHDDGFAAFLAATPEPFERGLYHDQLQRYFARFPREQVLVLLFEEMMADRRGTLERICTFIGVDPARLDAAAIDARIGAAKRPRFGAARRLASWLGNRARDLDLDWAINAAKRFGADRVIGTQQGGIAPLDPRVRAELMERYRAEIARLEVLLGRDLGLWTRSDAAGAA